MSTVKMGHSDFQRSANARATALKNEIAKLDSHKTVAEKAEAYVRVLQAMVRDERQRRDWEPFMAQVKRMVAGCR